MTNGRKLAIECDGPTHFENGDGQVYVQNDWERQMVLETAGWHFYRISYFDWMEDRGGTQKDILTYLHDFLDSKSTSSHKPESVKGLRDEASLPEGESKPPYKTTISSNSEVYNTPISTNISDEVINHEYTLINNAANAHRKEASTSKQSSASASPNCSTFSVGDREVNQLDLEKYLNARVGKTITIRYQSTRKNSAHHWRDIKMTNYDSIYIYSRHDDGYMIRFRRDRVVGFR